MTFSRSKNLPALAGSGLIDFVTSSVWNARKLMVSWLQTFYRQENEVVDLFYAITNCHGWIKSTEKVERILQRGNGSKLRSAIRLYKLSKKKTVFLTFLRCL